MKTIIIKHMSCSSFNMQCHDIVEILLKLALNTNQSIILTFNIYFSLIKGIPLVNIFLTMVLMKILDESKV